jgi:high-affinity iron transporter
MLSAALIVFREVLEAALIIGIVLTATRDVMGRTRSITSGITAGIGGACLMAYFADTLAQAAQGVGPELFNAGILLVATAMLAWHNLWMVQHGRALATQMNQVGQSVATGNRPVQVLAMVVALAVLREGAEVVLFAYGIAATGTDTGTLLMGGLLGIVAGMAVGGALYLGLLRIPTRHLFAVTSGLLVLLAAGMAAQASAFLIQADLLPAIKPVLWDSSAVLSEKSVFGQMLHTLVGYVDRPAGMQLLVYLSAVALIGGLTLAAGKPEAIKTAGVAATVTLAVVLLMLFSVSPAHAGHKVYYPKVERGETEIELRGHADFDKDPAIDNAQTCKVGVGHGFTDFWFTEIYVEVKKDAHNSSYSTEAYEWENLFQLTDPGKYWADMGFNIEYAHARKSTVPSEWELIPIVQKQLGQQLITLNVPFVYETGNNAAKKWGLEYAWQYKWLGNPALEFGFEGYGKLGEASNWSPASQQTHQLGPSLFGKLKTDVRHAWKYQLGILFGLTESTPQKTLYGNLEYEF